MAKYVAALPDAVIKDFEKIGASTEKIFGDMVEAGAQVAETNMIANLPDGIRKSNGMMRCLKITKVFKTPSDGGINCKVGFFGYFENEHGEKVPAPLVANVFEHGRSNLPFPKQPFMRQAFNKGQIEAAMLQAQKKASGGLLE